MFQFFFFLMKKRKKKAYLTHTHLSYMFYHLEKKDHFVSNLIF